MAESVVKENSEKTLLEPSEIEKEPWEREVEGIYRTIQFVQQKARKGENGLDRDDILAVHKMVMNDPFNPERTGVLRGAKVRVGCTINGIRREAAFTPADPYFLSEFFNEFAGEFEEKTAQISATTSIGQVVDLATWAHLRFIEIHPFEDGNGRTGRLIVDFMVRKARLPAIRDWGAANDEYKDVIDRSYREDNPNLFKIFLARKILKRLLGIEAEFLPRLTDGGDFKEYVKNRRVEAEIYLKNLTNERNS